jgi:hypothetical protein
MRKEQEYIPSVRWTARRATKCLGHRSIRVLLRRRISIGVEMGNGTKKEGTSGKMM